jgi:hypothetical protein
MTVRAAYTPLVGAGPFGVGTPVPTGPLPTPVLGSSRQIGTGPYDRGQYPIDATTGHPTFDTDVRQLTILALCTAFGSSAVAGLGRGEEPPTLDASFPAAKRSQVDAALSDLVKQKLLTIESVSVIQASNGRSVTQLRLNDLVRQIPFTVSIG